MPAFSVFRWRDGRGWLVLAGAAHDEIRGHALSRSAADGAVAVITLPAADAEHTLDDLADLGAPAGYIVDVIAEPDEDILLKIGEAGVVVISASGEPDEVRSALAGAAVQALDQAFQNGAVILAEGAAAQSMGAWLLGDGFTPDGFAWLEDAVIEIGPPPVGGDALAVLESHPEGLAMALADDAAVAFGPDGQVELWGSRRVAVTLGAACGGY
ncbi:MAG: hypothetical protein JNL34_00760 [Anaerolineae bacterium]|nr:hypothetical protein [Anaerolineae bacterium]